METITEWIQELARVAWESGGSTEAALMTPMMSKRFAEEWRVWATPDGLEITELMTDYGPIRIFTSPYCPPDLIYIASQEQIRHMAEDTKKLFDRTQQERPFS